MHVTDIAYCLVGSFFFFKQKTAYEMRISDWSSDVCSSDLGRAPNRTITNHARLVITKAWRTEKRPRLARVVSIMETPTKRVTKAAVRNTCQSGWPTDRKSVV